MNDRAIISLISSIRDRANRFILQELSKRNIYDLAPSHGAILGLLYHKTGRVNMGEIAKLIKRDKSTVTSLVNKLLKLGYIKKNRDENDRRICYISLTEKGEEIKGDVYEISDKLISKVYEGFSGDEKVALLRLLNKITI